MLADDTPSAPSLSGTALSTGPANPSSNSASPRPESRALEAERDGLAFDQPRRLNGTNAPRLSDSRENGPKQQADKLAPEEPAADPNGSDLGEDRAESEAGRKMGMVL